MYYSTVVVGDLAEQAMSYGSPITWVLIVNLIGEQSAQATTLSRPFPWAAD